MSKKHRPPTLIAASVLALGIIAISPSFSLAVRGARGTGGGRGATSKPTVNVPDADPKEAQQSAQDAAAARADRKKAEDNLASVIARLREEFEKSPEMVKAQADLKAAQAEYDATAKPALNALSDSADFKALKLAKGADEVKISALQGQGDKGAEIASLAQDSMKQGAAMTKLENDALAKDPAALSAKAKVAAAGVAIGKLRTQFNATLPQNADWLAAKKSLDDAVQKNQAADASARDASSKYAAAQAAHDAAQAQKDKIAREYANKNGGGKTPPPTDPNQ